MNKKRNMGLRNSDTGVFIGPNKLVNCPNADCDALRAITDIGKHYYRAIVVYIREDKYLWTELESLAVLPLHEKVYILPQLKLDGSAEDLLDQVDDYLDPAKKFKSHVLIDLINKENTNESTRRKETTCS